MKYLLNEIIRNAFLILPFLAIVHIEPAYANVETIPLRKGDVVSKEIAINPGFAVMFQLPSEVQALTLADQTAFACDKMPSDLSRILCKPLTQSPFSTNLVVSTAENEFNLVLTVDPSGKKHPFKYVFTDGMSKNSSANVPTRNINSGKSGASANNLMELFIDHFRFKPCRVKGENSILRFRCLDIIEVGTERFMRFSLGVHDSKQVSVIKISQAIEKLGGLTGLSVADEASTDLEYSLKQGSLAIGQETLGIVKLPSEDDTLGARKALLFMTDQGESGDLRVYGF